jgi:hypothetical protein
MQTLQLSKPVVSIEPQARKTCTADRSKTKILGSKFKTFEATPSAPHLQHLATRLFRTKICAHFFEQCRARWSRCIDHSSSSEAARFFGGFPSFAFLAKR